jgi:hypothetical protein
LRLAALVLVLVGCSGAVAAPLLGLPPAPSNITAEVYDRRATSMRVCWTNPADLDGGPLRARYELRYARRPISAVNFDDPSVARPAPAPAPGEPGTRSCAIVHGLYIENGYYFAVRAVRAPAPDEEPRT